MEKILVTGSSGFIGMHLCQSLLQDGVIVYGIDNMNDYYDVSFKISRLKQLSQFDNFKLQLNGHDRFTARDTKYFTRVQVWQHHSGAGGLDSSNESKYTGNFDDSIAVYSFALKPEEHQPSGTCNFSRIDNAELIEVGATTPITIFAVNYNVLRIMSGMGGLAYSN